jgi:hypothetical protein
MGNLEESNFFSRYFDMLGELLRSAGQTSKKPAEKKSIQRITSKIATELLKKAKIKSNKSKSEKKDNSYTKYNYITINKEKYILKTVSSYESGQLSIALWNDSETRLLEVLYVGYLKNERRAISVGAQKLSNWE